MIKINIAIDQNNHIQEIEMTGHAEYADEGYDIVCAAVSSQVISVENSLQQLLKVPVETDANEVDGGYLKLTMPDIPAKSTQHDAQLLLNHLLFAFEVLEESYPEFIKIKQTK